MRHRALLALPFLAAAPAAAQQAPAAPPQDWFSWKQMLGDLGGLRPQWEAEGIKLSGHYVSEVSGNPVGGREQGGAYAHEIALGADIDSKLFGWQGGTFHVLVTERAGSSLSKDKIGNILTVQEIYGDGQTVRLTELSYEQKLLNGRLDVEAGHINTENDFASSPVYFGDALWCEFQSNAICGTPIAAPINSNGYVAYPASAWGARVKAYPLPDYYVEAGAYEVNPTLYTATNGWKIGTSGAQGVFTTVETGITVGRDGFLGNYRVGAYYDNSTNRTVVGQATRFVPATSPVLQGLPFAQRAGRYGGWLLADQMIEREAGGKRGIAVFAALEWGDKETALVNWYGETGLVRHGTFPGRDDDTLALGFAIASINGTIGAYSAARGGPDPTQEFILETNYGVQLAPWFNLRPGLQYVWHPSGEAEIHNALVIDLKTVLTF
jgi:porin